MITGNFVDNLFGTIAGGHGNVDTGHGMDFIPVNGEGGTMDVSGKNETASWLGLKNRKMQLYAYEYCYALASVVDRLAEYDLTGIVEIIKTKGKGKQDPAKNEWATAMRKRLAQPNALQSWEQFRGQQIVYKKVFGFCPVLPIVPVGFESQPHFASAMINLPPWLFKAVGKNRFVNQTSIKNVVDHYELTIEGETIKFKPEDLFILEDGFLQDECEDYLLPKSKLVGLDMAVSNLCAAMEADNVLLKRKGPLGFISHDSAATKDAISGYIPMQEEEKRELQQDLKRYGMSLKQYQWVISRQAIKFQSTGFDVSQLGTGETIVKSEKAICHRLGYPYVLFEETESAYANGENAASSVYQNNIIPNNQKDLNKYNKFFKAEENECKIEAYFDHVSALQEDQLQQAQAKDANNSALEKEWNNGLITLNEWRTAIGYPTIPEGNIYKPGTPLAKPVEPPTPPPIDDETTPPTE